MEQQWRRAKLFVTVVGTYVVQCLHCLLQRHDVLLHLPRLLLQRAHFVCEVHVFVCHFAEAVLQFG